ncbi:MAG: hypothetical protein WDO24_26605 [Pseudomonadota bacterium]
MLESYLGRIPGEEAIDRLVDDVLRDPALADRGLIAGDPVTGTVIGVVRDPARVFDQPDSGLWQALRQRWTSAARAAAG